MRKSLESGCEKMEWYKIEWLMEEPVIIGHENSGTEKYINGSTVRGVFVKEAAKNLKFSKDIIFYDAYLTDNNEKCIPTPAVFEIDKHEYKNIDDFGIKIFNKLEEDSNMISNPVKIKSDFILIQSDRNIREGIIKLKEKLHINIKEEDMFRYESIEKGQKFYSYVKINEESTKGLTKEFEKIFFENKIIKMGKSRTTGYGNVKIIKCEKEKKFNVIKKTETNLKIITLYFFTKAIFRDKKGDTTFSPNDELSEIFGKEKIKLADSFVNVEIFGGYNSHWGIELPKETGIKAGSIYRYEVSGVNIEELNAKIKLIEENGLGYFKERGFGVVIVNPDLNFDKLLKGRSECLNDISSVSNLFKIKEIEKMREQIEKEIKKVKLDKRVYNQVLYSKKNKLIKINSDVSNSKLFRLQEIISEYSSLSEKEQNFLEFNDIEKISLYGYNVQDFLKKFIIGKEKIIDVEELKGLENCDLRKVFSEMVNYEIRYRKAEGVKDEEGKMDNRV